MACWTGMVKIVTSNNWAAIARLIPRSEGEAKIANLAWLLSSGVNASPPLSTEQVTLASYKVL